MAKENGNILMVLTSNSLMGETGEATGLWFEELATPYFAFVDAGAEVTLASIKGGAAPVDPRSLKPRGENDASVERFLADEAASAQLMNTATIEAIDVAGYDAVFLPGGHGTMWDLPTSESLGELLKLAWSQDKAIAAVCHGPAGLVGAKDQIGEPIVKGRRVTGFSDSEEDAIGLTDKVPFLLERRLRDLGGHYECAANFQPFAVRDGNLVTGQNPASSALTARFTLDVLADKTVAAR